MGVDGAIAGSFLQHPWGGPAALPLPALELSTAHSLLCDLQDHLQRLAVEGLEQGNTRLMRQHASQRYTSLLEQAGEQGEGE